MFRLTIHLQTDAIDFANHTNDNKMDGMNQEMRCGNL